MTQEREKTWAEYELEFFQGETRLWRLAARTFLAMLIILLLMFLALIWHVNPWVVVIGGGLAEIVVALYAVRKMRSL